MFDNSIPRRTFLAKSTTAVVASGLSTMLPRSVWAQPAGSNDSIGVGIVGLGIKGAQHLRQFSRVPGVRIVALCDADQERIDEQVQKLREQNQSAHTYQDYRDLLEDKAVDAVVIATPNYWHALMTIWACQAGKDVYVEKPVCHSIWEGLRMLEAEKKYGRIIQAGTQNRSNFLFDEGLVYLREGNLGKIQGIHGLYFKLRDSIGKVHGPQRIPDSVDYNLFQGPAPAIGLNRVKLHYDWHWQWATGNGDMGNNAAHTIDDIRRIMGDHRQPDRVMSVGGRFGYDDDGETANTHITLMDYGDFPVMAEIRNLPHKRGVDYLDHINNIRGGTIVFCEDGYMVLGWGGVAAYSKEGKRIKAWRGERNSKGWRKGGGESHVPNFVEAVRNQDRKLLNCPLELGTKAGEIFHLSNISYRSGFPATPEKIGESFAGTSIGEAAWTRLREHLGRNEIDLEKEPLTLGSWLSLQDGGHRLQVENSRSELTAQYLFQPRDYRSPFVVPDQV